MRLIVRLIPALGFALDSQALLLAGGFSVPGATNFCNLLPSQRIHSIELYAENALTMRR
jgi:hypothetical protein